ncbi:hypothetical protein LY76DRAFT_313495 [Colletotrichum caudatum]|nr:hypothetical protein LY76DRAFT_313495 [Colletotrichum caudatum]
MELRAFRRPLSLFAVCLGGLRAHIALVVGRTSLWYRHPRPLLFLLLRGAPFCGLCAGNPFFLGYTNNAPRSMTGNATGKSQAPAGYVAKSGTGESDDSGNENKDQIRNGLTAWENIGRASMPPPFGSEI